MPEQSSSAMVTLILGVGIALLLMIFIGSLGGQVYQVTEADIESIGNHQVNNQSFVSSNTTYVSLGNVDIQTGTLVIRNSTLTLGLANFSIDYDAGTAKLVYPSPYTGTTFQATYIWGKSEVRISTQNAIVNGFDALEKTGSYMPLLVLASVIGVVLFIVLGFTRFQGGGGSVL